MLIHEEAVHLRVAHAGAATRFYADVFEARDVLRIDRSDGGVGHAEILVGPLLLTVADGDHQLPSPAITIAERAIRVDVEDVDAAACRAWDAGATILRAPDDGPGALRQYLIRDPFGHAWQLSQRR